MTMVGDPRSGRTRSRSGGRESSQARGEDPYGGRSGGGSGDSGSGDKPSWDIEAAVNNRVEYLKSKYGGEAEKYLNRENIERKLQEAHERGVYESTRQVESSYQGSPVSRIEVAEKREFREDTHRAFEIRSNVGRDPTRQELEEFRGGLGEEVYRRELRGIEKEDYSQQYATTPFVYNQKKYFGEAAGEKILELQESGKYQDYLKRQELERQKRERDQELYENRLREFGRRRERFLTETGLKFSPGFQVSGAVPMSSPEPVKSKEPEPQRVVKMGVLPEIPQGVRDRVGAAVGDYAAKLKGKSFLGAKLTVVKDVLELPLDLAKGGLEYFEGNIEPKIKPYVVSGAEASPLVLRHPAVDEFVGKSLIWGAKKLDPVVPLSPKKTTVEIEGFKFTPDEAERILVGNLGEVRSRISLQEKYLSQARSDKFIGDTEGMRGVLSELRGQEKDIESQLLQVQSLEPTNQKQLREQLGTQGLLIGYTLGAGLPVASLPAAASYVGRYGASYVGAVGTQKGIQRLPLERLPGGQTTEDVLALGAGILVGGAIMGATGAVERKMANVLKSPHVPQQIHQVNLVSGDRAAGVFTGTRRVSDFYGTRNLGRVMGSFKEKPGAGVLRFATQGKGSLGTTRSSVGKMVYGFSDDVRNIRPGGLGVGRKAPVPAGNYLSVPSSGQGVRAGFSLPTNFQGVSRTASFRGVEGRALSVGRKALKSSKILKGDIVSRSGVAARQVSDDVWMGFSKTQSQSLKKVVRPGNMIQFNSEGLGRDAPRLSMKSFPRSSGKSVLLREVSKYIPSGRDRVTTESRFLTLVLDKVDDVSAAGSGGGVSRGVGGGGGSGSLLQAKLDSVGLIQRRPPAVSDLSGLVSEVLEKSSKSVSGSQADIGFSQAVAGGLSAFASRKPRAESKPNVKTASPVALEKPAEQQGFYSPTSLLKPSYEDSGGLSDLGVMSSLSALQESGEGLLQIHKPRVESVSRVSQAPKRLTASASDMVQGDLSRPVRELSPVLAVESGLMPALVLDSVLKPFSPGVPPAPYGGGLSGVPPGLVPGFGPASGYRRGGGSFERRWRVDNPLDIPDFDDDFELLDLKRRKKQDKNGFGFL